MRTFLLTALLVLSSVVLRAQTGITLGVNSATYSYTSDRKPVFGFNAGLSYHSALSESFHWKPELIYTVKGASVYPPQPIGSTNPYLKYVNRLNYIQLTSPFYFSSEIVETLNFDIGAGPYAAHMVSANSTAVPFSGSDVKSDFKIGSSATDDFKAFDAGVTFMAGLTMAKRIGLHFKYDLGSLNVNPTPNSAALKIRNVSFNVSYTFGSKP